MEAYMAMISMFGMNFAPRQWAYCGGQLQSVGQMQALFALLGSIWGGDGRSSFAYPDLRGRTPVGQFQGPGLSNIPLAAIFGSETIHLTNQQLPAHSHDATFTGTGGGGVSPLNVDVEIAVSKDDGNTGTATDDAYLSQGKAGLQAAQIFYNGTPPAGTARLGGVGAIVTGGGGGITGGTVSIGVTGSSGAVPLHQPSLGMSFCICEDGAFPPRN